MGAGLGRWLGRGLMVASVVAALALAACADDKQEPADRGASAPLPTAVAADVSPTTAPQAAVATRANAPASGPAARQQVEPRVQEYAVPRGSAPHDVAPAADGGVWYTAQRTGELGWPDPQSGETRHIKLGPGSAPHGVIVGPDGAPWITDGGQNAIVRVDPATSEVSLCR